MLLSAVFVSSTGRMSAGVEAWQAAAGAGEGLFVPSPSRRIRDDVISGGGVTTTGLEVAAEPLRRVAEMVGQIVGGPVADVRLVVPATWGPRRSMLLRQAAHRAGLPAVAVVPAPVAVADLMVAAGAVVPVGGHVAVCDLGGGVEATVLLRRADGFEVVSVRDDAEGGGLRLDEQLAVSLNGHTPPSMGTQVWWQVVAAARSAKEQLSTQPVVTVSLPPPHPPVVLTGQQVQAQASPLWEQAAQLTVEAVEAANLQPAELSAVFLTGGGAAALQAAQVVEQMVGRPVDVVPDPQFAAVRGAARAVGPPAGAAGWWPVMPRLPDLPVRRLLGVLVPAVASAALFVEFLMVKARHPGQFVRPVGNDEPDMPNLVLTWGQLGVASLLALLACLCGAAVLGAVLPANAGLPRAASSDAVRMGGGLVVAAVLGWCVAALYGVGASVYLAAPLGSFLRWAMLCTLPLALVAACTGVVAAVRGRSPAVGWHNWLRFPILSVVPAAVGMLLLAVVYGYMAADTGPADTVQRTGGFLIGVGAGLALVGPLVYRLVVVPPLAAVTMAIVDIHTSGILAAIYAAAVTCWWLQRLWQLLFHPDPWTSHA
ncbi:hypothetical protein GCM10023170_098620 [Phytohabitans houttuyneae]|uniref:Hsp70 protein n=2 Tax=Phytohabitans houttuyneae TaxID=1076126 RepID=A0A6V8K6W1_9ACTN|nr:hypothetical protein Phou_016670 [Phytohabitans houttuyneae]